MKISVKVHLQSVIYKNSNYPQSKQAILGRILYAGPILESKGMHAIFQKKGKKRQKKMSKKGKKGQNIWKFGQKYTKFENILKKGRRLHVILTYNKLLE